MSDTFWIKLYYEILHDKKMARMSDHLWRRTVELFLLAGENEKQGELPSKNDMCWSLREQWESLVVDLITLKGFDILSEADGVWTVVNFSKRQGPSLNALRQRKYKQSHKDVTSNVIGNVTEAHDDERYFERDCMSSASISVNLIKVLNKYEHEIGTITQGISEELKDAEQEYSADWVVAALDEASRNNKRSWAYAHAILKRWKVDGFQSNHKKNGSQPEPERYTAIE